MIDAIYEAVQHNPKATAWTFGIVNALWIAFAHFNKKRHEQELKQLQHTLDLDLERRRAVFALKVSSYERYVRMLDDFGKKYQTALGERMAPMFSTYLSAMLKAGTANDKSKEEQAIATFGSSVMSLMNEAGGEYLQLQAESKTLKLTASPDILATLEQLEGLTAQSMKTAQEFMRQFTQLFLTNDQSKIHAYVTLLGEQGANIQVKSRQLEQQMRADLGAI